MTLNWLLITLEIKIGYTQRTGFYQQRGRRCDARRGRHASFQSIACFNGMRLNVILLKPAPKVRNFMLRALGKSQICPESDNI
jgi:hypothetical protein